MGTGVRDGVTTAEAQRVKELERENKEVRRANEILKLASLSSTGRCNTCCESSAWRFKVQRLSRPGIQFQSNGIELKLVER